MPPLPPTLAGRITIARDPAAHGGPLAGLATALDAYHGHDAAIALVVGADMPRLAPAVLQLLVAALDEEPATGAAILESDPPATLPMAIATDLASLAANALLAENRRSLRALLDALHATTIPATTWRALDPDGHTLDDIDLPTTPDPATRALRWSPPGQHGVSRSPGVGSESGPGGQPGGEAAGRCRGRP